ncbi:DUF4229 domain-containing protein [Gordonia sp. VNK21]|uniref:DUF4229 domain-containing protein n=1 Tax=Gordonia sp. VNK21 TaxID=3382483 RepID=UPI0038D36031
MADDDSTTQTTGPGQTRATAGSLTGWVALYSLARLALVAVLAAIIMGIGYLVDVKVPVLVAALFGVLIALPLALVIFKPLRLKVNQQIAEVDADRAARRNDLQSRLRGERD